MTNISPVSLSDSDLLAATERAAATERRSTAALLALLAEVDSRRLYLGEGFSSLFTYATSRLCLSEPAAYSRITAARLSRRFPVVLPLVDEGALSLTTVGLLAPHLTDENHTALFKAARHKSKRDVERLVAALHPQPDIASSVRALRGRGVAMTPAKAMPALSASGTSAASLFSAAPLADAVAATPAPDCAAATASEAPRRPVLVAPIAPRRYLVRMTIGEETHQKLQRARDLL